jgi:hypothetical protein
MMASAVQGQVAIAFSPCLGGHVPAVSGRQEGDNMKSTVGLCVLLATFVSLMAGCTPQSSEKTVLAGQWQATGGPYLLTTFLIFDAQGNLQQMITRPAGNTDVTDNLIGTHSSVSGEAVTFRYDMPIVGTQSFSGTFNTDKTAVSGKMTLTTNIFLTTITTDEGDVTLTKVAEGS